MATRPPLSIRDVAEADVDAVLAINQRSVPAVNSLTRDQIRWFVREAEYFRVATDSSEIAGFLICLAPGTPYRSPNFRWLRERYENFLYIDRVAIAGSFQRLGAGSALYRDAGAKAGDSFPMLACEVNTRPRNRASIRFHRGLGFRRVGSFDHGHVEVQYMVRPLPFGAAE